MWPNRLYRLQHLHLLVADRLRVEGERWVHRDQREHLEHVVLDDVADRADLLVQLATLLDTEQLRNRDLDTRNRLATPDPFEQGVAEAEDEEVLNRLLAHVVVDAKDALLGYNVVKGPVELLRGLQIVPEGLLDDDRGALDEARCLDGLDQGGEGRWWDREVRDATIQRRGRSDPREVAVRRQWHEPQPSGERGEGRLLQRRSRELFDGRFREVSETLIVPVEGCGADDLPLARQQLLLMEVVQSRDELALREIAGRADDDDVLIGRRVERHGLRQRVRYLPVK